MSRRVPENHPLRVMFSSLTEDTFLVGLGVVDPPLIDYLSDLLTRAVHMDVLYRLRNAQGNRLEEVAQMMAEAEGRVAGAKREVHRQIGDFTLFWTGVYPEALSQLQSPLRKDHFVDYCEQGKRSYWIASTYDDEPYREEAPVLRRLSEEFEVCAFGLSRVRAVWERLADPSAQRMRDDLPS